VIYNMLNLAIRRLWCRNLYCVFIFLLSLFGCYSIIICCCKAV